MSPTCDITLDPGVLLDARNRLLREAQRLDGRGIDPPRTGGSSALTATVLDRVRAEVGQVAEDLEGLAGALGRFVDDLESQDGDVTAMFDLLRVRGLA